MSAFQGNFVRTILLVAFLTIFLSGCQTGGIPANAQWVNAKNPNADQVRDKDACGREAAEAFPPSVRSSGGAEMQSSCTGAGYTTSCTTSGGAVQVDSNGGRRAAFVHQCMRAKGWRPMVNGVDVDPDK